MPSLPVARLEAAIRRTLLVNDDTEIAAAADEVDTLFSRCLHLVDVDEGASTAEQRRILDRLTPEILQSPDDIDPAVRARIGMFLRSGPAPLFGAGEMPDDHELASAIADARMSLEPAPRGRPAETGSLAAEQLALGLAAIWRDWTGRRPAREVRSDEITGRYSEGGPFHRFVSDILALAPEELRQPRKVSAPIQI